MKEHASRNPALQAKKKGGFFNKKGPGTFFGPSASPTPFFPGHSNESPGPEPGGASNAEPAAVQTKLTVGEPNDIYEKEADATADKVVQRLSAGDDKAPAPPAVQKKCADCEAKDQKEGPPLQTKPIFDSKADPMDEPVRRKEASSATPTVTPSVESGLRSSKGGGSQLPASTRKQMESGLGADFSGVRIHNDGNARQMSKDLNAQAFTHGKDIYFNSGKYDPSGSGGKHLLAHELTHVVQQGGGSIKRKPATSAAPASAATTSSSATPAPAATSAPAPAPATIQRDPDPNSPGTPPNPGGGSSPGTPDPNSAQGQSTIPGPPYVKDGYTFKPDTKELRLPLLSLPTIKQDHGQDALWTFPRKLKADRDDDQTTVWTGDVTTATTAAVTTYLTDKDKTDGDNIYFLKGISTNFTLFGTADQIQQNSIVPKWDRKGGPRNHDIDHIVEMQLDGAPAATNLQLLDASANRSSGSKLHWEIIKRIKAGLKYFNDAKVPNVPADTDIIGAEPPTYNVFFEATDGFKLPTGGDGSMYWTRDEIKAATHLQQLKGMTLDEIKKIQGSATELVLFVRAGGGTPHTFSIPASAQPLVPGVDVTAVNLTNQAAAAGQQMGNIQVTLKPSLQKKLGLKDPVTINFNKVAGLANAGTLDLTGVDKSLAYKLRFTGLSPITVNNFDLGDEGLLISGIITADVPLIKDSPIDFSVQGEDIRISKTFNSGEIKGFPKPFIVNDVSLSIFASTEFGFGVEGDINFAIQGLGKGSVTGIGATSGGFGVKGEFAFDSKKFQGSKINFSYLQQQWTIGGTLIIPPGSGIKGVDSANMTVQYAAEKITADGSVKLTVPGIDKATLHAEFDDSGAFTVGGSVDLKALPGIKSGGKVTAQISKAAGGADYSLSITGEVEPNLPNVPKLNPKLTVSYIDGLFKAEGKMDFGTSGGMITGDVTVGVTNGTVADGVLQGGEGGKNISVYGKGTLHFIPFKGVDASITVKVNTDGKALFSFSLDTKVTPFDPIEKTIPILDVSQDIPLVGVPFLSLNLHIGFHARLDIKWLPLTIGVKASMTDKSYDDLVGGKFDSDFALTVETSGSVALVIGVEAGVSVTVAVFVGGATLNGDVTLQANALLKGELDAGWGGEKGLLLKGGKGTAQADLQLIFGLSGRAFVDVDLLFTKKNVWEKKWDLAKSDPKTLYSLGIEAPFEFDDNNNLKPFDPKQIKFNPPLDSDTANKQGNSAVNPDGANQAQKPDDEKVKNDLRQEIKTEMRDAGKDKSRDMDAFAADLTTKLTASSDASLAGFVKQTVQDELNAIKAENASSSSPNDPSAVSRKPMNGSPDVIRMQPAGQGTPQTDQGAPQANPDAAPAKQGNAPAKSAGAAAHGKADKPPAKPDFKFNLNLDVPKEDPKPDYSKGSKDLDALELARPDFHMRAFGICDSVQKGGSESSFVTDVTFEFKNPTFIFQIANEIYRGMHGGLEAGELGVEDPSAKEVKIAFYEINNRIITHAKEHFTRYRKVVLDKEKLIRKKLLELPGKSNPKKIAKKDLEAYVDSLLKYLIADLQHELWSRTCDLERTDYPKLLNGIQGVFVILETKCLKHEPKELPEPKLVNPPGKDKAVKQDKPKVQRQPDVQKDDFADIMAGKTLVLAFKYAFDGDPFLIKVQWSETQYLRTVWITMSYAGSEQPLFKDTKVSATVSGAPKVPTPTIIFVDPKKVQIDLFNDRAYLITIDDAFAENHKWSPPLRIHNLGIIADGIDLTRHDPPSTVKPANAVPAYLQNEVTTIGKPTGEKTIGDPVSALTLAKTRISVLQATDPKGAPWGALLRKLDEDIDYLRKNAGGKLSKEEELKYSTKANAFEATVRAQAAIIDQLINMDQPHAYLEDIAAPAMKLVEEVKRQFEVSLFSAYGDKQELEDSLLATAQQGFAALPYKIAALYLQQGAGLEALVAQYGPMRNELYNYRGMNHRPPLVYNVDEHLGKGNIERLFATEIAKLRTDLYENPKGVLREMMDAASLAQAYKGVLALLILNEEFIYFDDNIPWTTSSAATRLKVKIFRSKFKAHIEGLNTIMVPGHPIEPAIFQATLQDTIAKFGSDVSDDFFRKTLTDVIDDFNEYEFIVGIVKAVLKTAAIVAASAFTAGEAGLALGAELESGSLLATGAVTFTEALAFTATSRLTGEALGMPSDVSFTEDLLTNWLMFGFLKKMEQMYKGITNFMQKTGRLTTAKVMQSTVAKFAFNIGTLQAFAAVHQFAKTGKGMTAAQFGQSTAFNTVLSILLHVGRFVNKPLADKVEARIRDNIVKNFGSQLAGLEKEREALKVLLAELNTDKTTAPDKLPDALSRTKALAEKEMQLILRAGKAEGLTAEALDKLTTAYRQKIEEANLRLAQLGVDTDPTARPMFREIKPGTIAFDDSQAALVKNILDDFYQENKGNVNADGKNFIGKMGAETVIYIPESEAAKTGLAASAKARTASPKDAVEYVRLRLSPAGKKGLHAMKIERGNNDTTVMDILKQLEGTSHDVGKAMEDYISNDEIDQLSRDQLADRIHKTGNADALELYEAKSKKIADDAAFKNALKGMKNKGGGRSLIDALHEAKLDAAVDEVIEAGFKELADDTLTTLKAKGFFKDPKVLAILKMDPAEGKLALRNAIAEYRARDLAVSDQLAKGIAPGQLDSMLNVQLVRKVPGFTSIADWKAANSSKFPTKKALDKAAYKLREGEGQVWTSVSEIDYLILEKAASGTGLPSIAESGQVKSGDSEHKDPMDQHKESQDAVNEMLAGNKDVQAFLSTADARRLGDNVSAKVDFNSLGSSTKMAVRPESKGKTGTGRSLGLRVEDMNKMADEVFNDPDKYTK